MLCQQVNNCVKNTIERVKFIRWDRQYLALLASSLIQLWNSQLIIPFFTFQAEEITLTIGQAFELAYKKFLESKGKDLENQKQSMVMQKRIEILENENSELKKRLMAVANIKGDNDVKQYMRENNVSTRVIHFFFSLTHRARA